MQRIIQRTIISTSLILLMLSFGYGQDVQLNPKHKYTEFNKNITTFSQITPDQIALMGNSGDFNDTQTKQSITDFYNDLIVNRKFFVTVNPLNPDYDDYFQRVYKFQNEKENKEVMIKLRASSEEYTYKAYPSTQYELLNDQMLITFRDTVIEFQVSFALNDFAKNENLVMGIARAKVSKPEGDFTLEDVFEGLSNLSNDFYDKLYTNKRNKRYFSVALGAYSATRSAIVDLAITPTPKFSIVGHAGYGFGTSFVWQAGLAYNIIAPGEINKFRASVYATYGISAVIKEKALHVNDYDLADLILREDFAKTYMGANFGGTFAILFNEAQSHGIQAKLNFTFLEKQFKKDSDTVGNYPNVDEKPNKIVGGAGLSYLVEF